MSRRKKRTKRPVLHLKHTAELGEVNHTAAGLVSDGVLAAEQSGASSFDPPRHFSSGRQVEQSRCFKNNPPFLPCQSSSSEKQKTHTDNTIPASAKYQTWPLKRCGGAGLCRMFHGEVVVVGDVGWSQKPFILVSEGR